MILLTTVLFINLFVTPIITLPFTCQVSIYENAKTGHQIADASAIMGLPKEATSYKPLGERLLVSSRYISGKRLGHNRIMSLSAKTGLVTLTQPVDREELCMDAPECIIQLKIFAVKPQKLLKLRICIKDVNDNPPKFPARRIILNVSEGAQVGEIISLSEFMAHDTDLGKYGEISYSILQNPFLEIENTNGELQLRLKKQFDYETSQVEQMTLIARDHGEIPLSNQVEILVHVLDANDNDPIFQKQEYFVNLRENLQPGHVIARVHATDKDSKSSGSLSYSISRRNKKLARDLVDVNPIKGEIVLKKTLDREQHDKLQILIEARDSNTTNQRVGRTWLNINVEDINDNMPLLEIEFILSSRDKTVYLPENSAVGTYLAYVTAKDLDSGKNGNVNLKIPSISILSGLSDHQVDTRKPFNLTNSGFLCLNGTVDRELVNTFEVVIMACDLGKPPKCSNETVVVRLLDVNDHAPVFLKSTLKLVVPEDTAVGTLLATLQATDGDNINPPYIYMDDYRKIYPSPYGEIYYHIINGSDKFVVDPHSGQFILAKLLDRERTENFQVTVRAKDGGRKKALQGTCTIQIVVTDINDNKPLFTNPRQDNMLYYATILRDDVILQVQAVDFDANENGTVFYTVFTDFDTERSSKTPGTLFLIDQMTGNISLNFSNTRLNSSLGHHKITVEASDRGVVAQKTRREVIISVTDAEVLPIINSTKLMTSSMKLVIATSCGSTFAIIVIVLMIILCRKRENLTKTRIPSEEKKRKLKSSNTNLKKKSESDYKALREVAGKKECCKGTNNHFDNCLKSTSLSNKSKFIHPISENQERPDNRSSLSNCSESKTLLHPNHKTDFHHNLAINVTSPIDADSGRGDSDAEESSTDVTQERAHQSRFRKPFPSASPACTEQCLVLGHSDACWMPKPDPGLPRIQQPIAYSSNPFNSQSSLYVELSSFPANSHWNHSNFCNYSPRYTNTKYNNYPANELSSLYSNIITDQQYREIQRRKHLQRVIPKINVVDEEVLEGPRPGSCASNPPILKTPSDWKNGYSFSVNEKTRVRRHKETKYPCLERSASADLLLDKFSSANNSSNPGMTFPKQNPKSNRLSFAFTMTETQAIVDRIDELLKS